MFNSIKAIFVAICLFLTLNAISQNTVGLIYNNGGAFDGYTLFTPESNEYVYLINNCGEVVNQWTFSEQPGNSCYLLENGNLLRAGKDSLEIRDWDNNQIWSYATTDNGLRQHHDIEPLPNGNILCLCRDIYSSSEIIEEGRNPSNVAANIRLEKIVEIEPVGSNDANIVWEWKLIDHLIQDYDPAKENYGVVEDHPELIDINYNNGENQDWVHMNGIDYNADLDQILMTVRHFSEILIIDHSTSIAEAAGHSGGNSGKGGDILWRWGNPEVYKQGTIADRKLLQPHDAKWVENGYLDEGKISVFNNGGDGTSTESSVHLIQPDLDGYNYNSTGSVFNPADFDWTWNGIILGVAMYEESKSGTHSLPNGNFIICETSKAKISEITKSGEHVWTYINPSGSTIYNQFDDPVSAKIFRAERYPVDFIGFSGQDLTPQGIMEDQNDVTDVCITHLEGVVKPSNRIINPVANNMINFTQDQSYTNICIYDMFGRKLYSIESFSGNTLHIDLKPGVYIIHLNDDLEHFSGKVVVQ